MWIYVALGVTILVSLNALIVVVVIVAAQHAHAVFRQRLDPELRELLLCHVRPLSSRNDVGADPEIREAA